MKENLEWTWKEWKQHRKQSDIDAEAVYAKWPKMSEEDRQVVLDSYDKPWHHEYFGNPETLCHVRNRHGQYFRGHCEWQTIEELRAGDWDGLSTFANAAVAIQSIKQNMAVEHPDFLDTFESYEVVPVIVEKHRNTLSQKTS